MALSVLSATAVSAEDAVPAEAEAPKSKNLIVLIGDGMGPAQVTAARNYLMYNKGIDHLTLDSIYVGQATTYADRGEDGGTVVSGVVTDSASAGTAFATGNKTYNAAISISNEDVSVPFASVIEASELAGKATGLVSTARITHATPAVYASHVRSRDNENAIASQYLDSGVDVLLGGGSANFISKEENGKRSDKTIIDDFEDKGYTYISDRAGLEGLTEENDKVLGLFGGSHVSYVPDRSEETPNLAEMTGKALDILSKDEDGFTIMIEGGRIDHAAHANDFPSMIQEVLDFDAAVKAALDFAKKDGNTSIVITADHETGGLSLSRDNIYELNIDLWDKQKNSSESLVGKLKEAATIEDVKAIVAANTWITDLTDEEAELILAGDGSSYGREGGYNAVISKRLLVGWSGHGHSAVDVGVWAYGPIADMVTGQIDNTQIALASAEVIGVDLEAATAKLQEKYLYPKFKVSREGQVLFPAKALAEALGGKVEWNADSRTATITHGDNTVEANIETGAVVLNGTASELASDVDNGKLYLPLEAFNELTGLSMTWDTLSERIVK
ncbi:alkaline phosphatase [Paenibacillus sp. SCIV0701]|uniref:Alkaline phosphatase n=2 Tax=Paenibacillus soyae TaxID=2969249 RepID=A0A9X2MSZ7_9BACL|nr:alkaline phosphatase [Paenibacillus soyae]MCR2805900.1 alkaline phosphatase [Paenibacillus soyae]